MRDVPQLVKRLSNRGGVPIDRVRAEAEHGASGLSPKARHERAIALLDAARAHLDESGWVRARTAIVAALSTDPGVLVELERRCLLFDPTLGRRPRDVLLDLLLKDGEAPLDRIAPGLGRRLSSYRNLALAQRDLAGDFEEYRHLLTHRPRYLLKAAIACADIAFLARTLPLRQVAALHALLPDIAARTSEELAEIVSRIVAEASEIAPLRAAEVDVEVSAAFLEPTLKRLFHVATARWALADFQKSVLVFGHDVIREEGNPATYVLRPADREFERRLRISHATGVLIRESETVKVAQLYEDAVSLMDFARLYAQRLRHCEVVPRPFRRVVVRLPLAEVVTKFLPSGQYFDDLLETATNDDLEVHAADLERTELAPSLTVAQFLDLYRTFRLQAALHTTLVREGANGDSQLLVNSLVPVMSREQLVGMLLDSTDVTAKASVDAFLDVLTWVSNRAEGGSTRTLDHLELQYTPIVQFGDQYLLSPRLVLNANALRNVLAARRKRVKGAGDVFGQRVAELLREAFRHVAVGKKYSIEGLAGDVDVAVLDGNVLYLFECKHSLAATTAHEHRDLLEDARKGVAQLARAQQALSADRELRQRLRQWFPTAVVGDVERLRLVPCVVTATRMFSGSELNGIPIRDVFSLRNVVRSGTIEMGTVDEDFGWLRHVYSFWRGDSFTPEDLLDFLRLDGLFWRARGAHTRDLRNTEVELGSVKLEKESSAVMFDAWEEAVKSLEALGLRLVTKEHGSLGPLRPRTASR